MERDNIIHNYIPAIHDTANSYALINVLRSKNLYPDIDPPEFLIDGGPQHGGSIAPGDVLTMTNPNGAGTIYYTLDGADPRKASATGRSSSMTLVAVGCAQGGLGRPTGNIGLSWTGGALSRSMTRRGRMEHRRLWALPAASATRRSTRGYKSHITYDVETQMYGPHGGLLHSDSLHGLCLRYRRPQLHDPAGALRRRFHRVSQRHADRLGQRLRLGRLQRRSGCHHDDVTATFFEDIRLLRLRRPASAGRQHPGDSRNERRRDQFGFPDLAELVAGVGANDYSPLLSPSVRVYTEPVSLAGSTTVKARIWGNGQWSALNEAMYTVSPSR